MFQRQHNNTSGSVVRDVCRDLYHDVYRELLAFLTGRVHCRQTAADLTQESYPRVLAARYAGQVVHDPRALLYRAARHAPPAALRRAGGRQRQVVAADAAELPLVRHFR